MMIMTTKMQTRLAPPVNRNMVLLWIFEQEANGARFELVNDGKTMNVWHQPWPPEVEAFYEAAAALAHDVLCSMPHAVM